MIITNYNNQYVKITSDYLKDFFDNPADYSSIVLTTNINCCQANNLPITQIATVPADEDRTFLHLNNPVVLGVALEKLFIQSLNSGLKFNVLTSAIELNYVAQECLTESCTLEDFAGYFAPLFKVPIDAWFADNGIVSNVTVTFSGNTVIISNIPDNFIMYGAEYGGTVTVPFTFADVETVAFANADGIFISPEAFGQTSLIDGIYKITLKFLKTDQSYIQETNCAFIDVETKCKVAAYLQALLKEVKTTGAEKTATMTHLLHYALINGSNCGCNCDELCIVYKELLSLLETTTVDPLISNDCGC